ncbi:MAG: hypothetical protein ABSB80_02510 [Methanoregula sp.]|uniref:hypothetical protein n=1 Tax=Methanoregula sp. TaxID=2052170 RepID=UPI003D10C035
MSLLVIIATVIMDMPRRFADIRVHRNGMYPKKSPNAREGPKEIVALPSGIPTGASGHYGIRLGPGRNPDKKAVKNSGKTKKDV